MKADGIRFHNVAALERVESREGRRLQRVPESVRTELNEGARTRMCHPAGAELRFVPEGPVEVTLSSDVRDSLVRPFWGDFQAAGEEVVIGEGPQTVTLSPPEKLSNLRPAVEEGLRFAPNVCRLVLPGDHRGGHVYFHGVEGDARPPTAEEVPDRRYLAYGTSITEGEAPSAETLTYVNQTARRLGADAVNLGSCGTAYCDPAMAEHIAARDDWDVATLSLSVNMVGRFSVEEFRARAASMIDTVAAAHPETPVACITLFPHARDYLADDGEAALAEEFRETLRDAVADCGHENVHLVEGPDLLPTAAGMTTDLVHPGDDAMIRIGEALAARLEPLLAA
ncbi:SGNH/GDSL hydrolase family protein [Halogeometricum luteum]|uniref:GDSL-type esterase/lipase family protein n=1 Tax=Halogeometricum luteum TaxID=2950537 RepID=A0ABU2G3W5_9EURY|nr:SGNH/GDSL hydrolase family protein [Halogeometricum sp. S3BR5-2]MDS0295475.1 GDSL-type esterase/lipase family protein [Halogeometricum sp. S3BR5-2]